MHQLCFLFLALCFSFAGVDAEETPPPRNAFDGDGSNSPCIVQKFDGESALAGGLCVNVPGIYGTAARYTRGNYWGSTTPRMGRSQSDLPKNFFWGNIHGVNYLTVSRNQHIPQYCGSCWAFGTTSAISDRIKIMRRHQFPEINLAPQVLINCNGGGTCQGGNTEGVYRYLAEYGLPDETCQNYQAQNQRCLPTSICKNCNFNYATSNTECTAVKDFSHFYINDFDSTDAGSIRMYHSIHSSKTDNIMREIYKRGPVSCTIFATDRFDEYSGGIYYEKGIHWRSNHIVSLVGWGESEDGIPYWIGRNSWGTYWGENGFFRIVRGDGRYNLGIENGCTWAVPKIPKSMMPDHPLPQGVPYGEFLTKYHDPNSSNEDDLWEADFEEPVGSNLGDNSHRRSLGKPIVKKKTGKVKRETAKRADSHVYDIRKKYGINFASVNRNQNNPLYCESSWAQAATSALNDRFALLKNASHPEVVLSVQVLLSCVKTKKSNGCHGGDVADAYEYIRRHSIPDESCSPYEAIARECSALHICKSCWPDGCHPLHSGEYTPYTISNYGQVSGDAAVMKEIDENGPVACHIRNSDSFLSYKGGIFSDKAAFQEGERSKKYVVLSGWGEKDGVKYWIGRNSWGTYWGESGWFKVAMGDGDLGITQECYWATPAEPLYRYLYTQNSISGIARIKREFRSREPSQASVFGVTVS